MGKKVHMRPKNPSEDSNVIPIMTPMTICQAGRGFHTFRNEDEFRLTDDPRKVTCLWCMRELEKKSA